MNINFSFLDITRQMVNLFFYEHYSWSITQVFKTGFIKKNPYSFGKQLINMKLRLQNPLMLSCLREYKIWQNLLLLRFDELTNLTEMFVETMRKMQKLSSQLQGRLKNSLFLDSETIFFDFVARI